MSASPSRKQSPPAAAPLAATSSLAEPPVPPIDYQMDESEALLHAAPELHTSEPPARPRAGCRARVARSARLLTGIALLLGVAVIWVAAAQVMQYLLDENFKAPFTFTWINTAEFVILLPLQWARERYRCCSQAPAKQSDWRAALKAALIVALVWAAAQGTYNASLAATSVSSSTVLSTTSCAFTFGLSLVFLKERFRWSKAAGVAITLGGAVLVALSDRSDASTSGDRWWGDALAVVSAVCYGGYTTLIRALIPDGSAISMNAFFGLLGATNLVALAPIVGILYATGVETPQGLPPKFIALVLAKGLFDNVLSDVMWARAVQLTSPTVATVALSLTIPIAMASDWVLHGRAPAGLLVGGAVAVTLGFVLSTVSLDAEADAQARARAQAAAQSAELAPAAHAADAAADVVDTTALRPRKRLETPDAAPGDADGEEAAALVPSRGAQRDLP